MANHQPLEQRFNWLSNKLGNNEQTNTDRFTIRGQIRKKKSWNNRQEQIEDDDDD